MKNTLNSVQREQRLREVLSGARCILWEAHVTELANRSFDWKLQILSPESTRKEFGFVRSNDTDGDSYVQHIPPDEMARMNDVSHDALRHRKAGYHQEFCLYAADGGLRYMNEDVSIQQLEPGVFHLIGVQVDITERKRAEEALRRTEQQLRESHKIEAVAHFAGGTAQSFSNLMMVVGSYNKRILASLPAESPIRKDAEMLQKAVERAAALNRQLLTFGRKQRLQPRPVNVNTLVADMEKMLRPIIGQFIEFAAVLDEAPGIVNVDATQLELALMNLAINARDAMPAGGKLVIETLNIDVAPAYARESANVQPGPYVLLAITDTGCGMDPEVMSHLFEPFFTTKGMARGAGLGLATVYSIIRQAGGDIQVTSHVGQGTRFRIYLPRIVEPKVISPSDSGQSQNRQD